MLLPDICQNCAYLYEKSLVNNPMSLVRAQGHQRFIGDVVLNQHLYQLSIITKVSCVVACYEVFMLSSAHCPVGTK